MTVTDVAGRVGETGAVFGLAVFVAYLVGDLVPGGDPTVVAGAVAIGVARFYGILTVFPLFTENDVSGLIAMVVALTLSWPVVAFAVSGLVAEPMAVTSIFLLAAREFLIGCLVGALYGAPFWGLQAAAHLIDFGRDASMPNTANPLTSEETTPLGPVFVRCALALFVAGGGLLDLLASFYGSFGPLPVFGPVSATIEGVFGVVTGLLDEIWIAGLVHAAPIAILLVILSVTFALVQRFFRSFSITDEAPLARNLVALFGLVVFAAFYDGWTVDLWRQFAASTDDALGLAP